MFFPRFSRTSAHDEAVPHNSAHGFANHMSCPTVALREENEKKKLQAEVMRRAVFKN